MPTARISAFGVQYFPSVLIEIDAVLLGDRGILVVVDNVAPDM